MQGGGAARRTGREAREGVRGGLRGAARWRPLFKVSSLLYTALITSFHVQICS